ncbi:septal ring lytic transglycosylase RlpA family protein [Roseomonas marmotae]|uniref:Endolytic peptidoglycan transglycosylase RlpA n=1 Tax=Roseomonas marmotae TaxID=2768161 RepID=A0ABS3KCU9_9PROT|nr:RlpA-like double-psi beta-barrel domain-containing protein [Roseomonas marmotae]MBO1075296.1 SPOR domain-containing protein [Roseomonas marmotae]QTI78277.1 SPOR domain-containing protein [Roseomonas marmotae]
MTTCPRRLALLLPLLAACTPRPPGQQSQPRYTVGGPYEMGGTWSYPQEDFALRETGLATVIPDTGTGRVTANGEVYDPTLLTAAHRTLQLPAVLAVTNLENGLTLRVRVNDRGPAQAGRVVALSRRAADLLRVSPAGTQVSVAVDAESSRALAAGLPQPESSRIAIDTAPREALQTEILAPPPGARIAEQVRQGRDVMPAAAATAEPVAVVPERLPERLVQGHARPGQLFVQASSFTTRDAAQRQAARLPGARVEALGAGRSAEYRVRLGPYGSVAQADAALEMTRRSGVSGARILVD